jgi:2-polyprenyl-3-methyl-5-hydroxy-6-metoxy-1,4-benzoquinol methylase
MMGNKDNVQSYFEENAAAWVTDAYAQSGHNYPTPMHRLRVLRTIFADLAGVSDILDVGCGGGNLAFTLAGDAKSVTGLDQSLEMLKIARKNLSLQGEDIQKRVTFQEGSLQDLDTASFDALTAMGIIGYLPEDAVLFEVANRVLRPGGYAVISFRNRLFNLFSLSHRTKHEVDNGAFNSLQEEAAELHKEIDEKTALELVKRLHFSTGELLQNIEKFTPQSPTQEQGIEYVGQIEARQTTPNEAKEAAKNHGFEAVQLYGIHPHWSLPALNKMLPPQVYNVISDSLIPLETQPCSLLWSSVFIGVFRKV